MSLSQEVNAFGQALGLDALTLNEHGVAEIALGDDHTISIEAIENDAVVLATWLRPYLSGAAMESALRGAWLDDKSPLLHLMQIGLLYDGAHSTLLLAHRASADNLHAGLMETWTAHFLGLFDAIEADER